MPIAINGIKYALTAHRSSLVLFALEDHLPVPDISCLNIGQLNLSGFQWFHVFVSYFIEIALYSSGAIMTTPIIDGLLMAQMYSERVEKRTGGGGEGRNADSSLLLNISTYGNKRQWRNYRQPFAFKQAEYSDCSHPYKVDWFPGCLIHWRPLTNYTRPQNLNPVGYFYGLY